MIPIKERELAWSGEKIRLIAADAEAPEDDVPTFSPIEVPEELPAGYKITSLTVVTRNAAAMDFARRYAD